jgi:hypothetical protein
MRVVTTARSPRDSKGVALGGIAEDSSKVLNDIIRFFLNIAPNSERTNIAPKGVNSEICPG